MSRSRKKVSILGNTTASSEKTDKQLANRRLRRISKQLMKARKENLPQLKEVSNRWNFSKDGKSYKKSVKPKDLRK